MDWPRLLACINRMVDRNFFCAMYISSLKTGS